MSVIVWNIKIVRSHKLDVFRMYGIISEPSDLAMSFLRCGHNEYAVRMTTLAWAHTDPPLFLFIMDFLLFESGDSVLQTLVQL